MITAKNIYIACACVCVALLSTSCVGIRLDNSFDNTAGTRVTSESEFTYDISPGLGKKVGTNLFHSFSKFSVNKKESVRFLSNGIDNIIVRVTGVKPSKIAGLLEAPGATLWFVNPNGIKFRPGASLNVKGSSHTGTADYIVLQDGWRFDATTTADPEMAIANGTTFGFLDADVGSIRLASPFWATICYLFGKPTNTGVRLEVDPGKTLSLVGGSIKLRGSTLKAPGGRINLASIASVGESGAEVVLRETGLDANDVTAFGKIDMVSSTLDVNGKGAGDIYLRGGKFRMNTASKITAATVGATDGVINIAVDELNLHSESSISTEATNASDDSMSKVVGASMDITAKNIVLDTGSKISASSESTPVGPRILPLAINGAITIKAEESIAIDGKDSSIMIDNTGHADNVEEGVGDLTLTASRIDVKNRGSIKVSHMLGLPVSVLRLEGVGTLTVSGDGKITTAGTSSFGGEIIATVDNLILRRRGIISSNSDTGASGAITITAKNTIDINDAGSSIQASVGEGLAGNITLKARTVNVSEGSIESQNKVRGRTGATISIDAGIVNVNNGGRISTSTTSIGQGGNIDFRANHIIIDAGGKILSRATGAGNAGSISIVAGDSLQMRNSSSVETSAERSAGGNVDIKAKNFVYLLDSEISASANGVTRDDDGGNVTIDPTFVVLNNSTITAQANAGNGGIIDITTDFFIIDKPLEDVLKATSTGGGADGEVIIQSPNQDVTAAVTILDASFLDVSGLLRERCAAAAVRERSSFTVASKGGVPRAPDSYFPSALPDIQRTVQASKIDQEESEAIIRLSQTGSLPRIPLKELGCR